MKKICNVFLLINLFACNAQNKKIEKPTYKAEAVKLNNLAMDIYSRNLENKDSIRTSINLLSRAIKINSTYYLAYSNKADLLCDLGNYSQADSLLDTILTINPHLVTVKTLKAFILEKSGHLPEATILYNKVLTDYTQKLKTDSTNVSLMLNRAFIYFFTDGYEKGIKEYNVISSRYPDNKQVMNMKESFISFERKKYIDDLWADNIPIDISN